MKTKLVKNIAGGIIVGLSISLAGCRSIQSNQPGIVPPVATGAKPELISSQFAFTEGPAADKSGNVYFTDQPNNKIWVYTTAGELKLFKDQAGRSNGLYFDKKGNLLAAADEHNQLWSISPTGEVKVLLKDLDGKLFNGPNDLWIHPNGGIYFTDPYYQRNYWTRKSSELDGKKVYYLAPGSSKAVVAADQYVSPNGIIGTPDGKYLYVADIGDQKTYKYTIQADGSLANRQLFVNMGSDGMTIDNRGNIYLTGKGVTIVDPQGQVIQNIPIDAGWTANVTFGGKKRDKLFITASQKLYVLDMNVTGPR